MRRFLLMGGGVAAGLALGFALIVGAWFFMHNSDSPAAANTEAVLAGAMHGSGQAGGMGYGRGMMAQGGMRGMMGGAAAQSAPTAVPDDGRAADVTVTIVAQSMTYSPARVSVKAGQTVRFVIENRDSFAHNFVSAPAGIAEHVIPGGTTQSFVWTAPAAAGSFRAVCTYHPGMVVQVDVQ